jgi:hypothetical protein
MKEENPMEEKAETKETFGDTHMPGKNRDLYYSVEIPVSELGLIYQFKIWRMDSIPMFVTVGADSGLLPWLHPGDRVRMKYYSPDPVHPCANLDTEICGLKKQEAGRLRGLYIVGLEIVEGKGRDKGWWTDPYRRPREISYNALLNYV